MLSSLTLFQGQHECTSTRARGSNGESILQNEAWHLHVAVANRPAYYEDIKRVVSASGCTKSKVVKRKFEDRTCADADAAAAAADAAADDDDDANPATPPDGGAAAASCGEEPPPTPSPGGRSGGGKGRAGGGG
jgi:hypothetical protein